MDRGLGGGKARCGRSQQNHEAKKFREPDHGRFPWLEDANAEADVDLSFAEALLSAISSSRRRRPARNGSLATAKKSKIFLPSE
jgi:hypothetical protein